MEYCANSSAFPCNFLQADLNFGIKTLLHYSLGIKAKQIFCYVMYGDCERRSPNAELSEAPSYCQRLA